MLNSNLGLGPMSSEIIEAVFRYSHYHRKQLMLIASRNQIDYAGGYVNNWDTRAYCDFIKKMRIQYEFSDVINCRDHCGPGFSGNMSTEDAYKTMETDIENGFDLIHIDFCLLPGGNDEKLLESKKAIDHCHQLNPRLLIEVGTDENLGDRFFLNSLVDIEKEVQFFRDFCDPEFYVFQTGSLIKEINQIGKFNRDFARHVSERLHDRKIKIKEHNADYLSRGEIEQRKGIIDAMNIAPQLGVVQTSLVLTKCLIYGVKIDDFMEVVINGRRWKKWLYKNNRDNAFLCLKIAGHYHFASPAYMKIIDELEKHLDIHEAIIDTTLEVIGHYESCY